MRFGLRVLVTLTVAGPGLAACADATSDDRFATTIAPIVERRCAAPACHGLASSDLEAHADPAKWLTFRLDEAGRIVDLEAALTSVKHKISAEDQTACSTFLRKTISPSQGGVRHFAGALFGSVEDPDYRALFDWAAEVDDGQEGADAAPLSALEDRFAADVYPFLVRSSCATATCHGELNFGGAAFRSPVNDTPCRSDLRSTYHEARRNLFLSGDPLRSRLISKVLPIEAGGIPHKGGNDLFFAGAVEDQRDVRATEEIVGIAGWIAEERTSALKGDADEAAKGEARAILFVGGPIASGDPFEPTTFTPGTEIYLLRPPFVGAAPIALTAFSHQGPVEIRDPAVSHDGRTIVFSRRDSEGDAFNVYSMSIDGDELRQLTFDRAPIASSWPIFGPADGEPSEDGRPRERIYFVSNRSRQRTDRALVIDTDLYVMDLDGGNVERLSYTPVAEVNPTFLASSEFSGTLAYTIERSVGSDRRGPVFRFPIDHNPEFHLQPEAHVHFGVSTQAQIYYGLRELPNGRAVLTLFDSGNVWRGAQLAVLDRQLAVELPEGLEPTASVPGFRHALTIISSGVARVGTSTAGIWRDPTPMPDGSIVVAHDPDPIDLSDRSRSPRPVLARVTLVDDRTTLRPKIAQVEMLTGPELIASQPVAVYPRAFEDDAHPRVWIDPEVPATIVHGGVEVVEALLAKLVPVGARRIRDDLRFVRLLSPVSPLEIGPVAPAETRDGRTDATTVALHGGAPLRALGEVPVSVDGSIAARVPPGTAVRLSSLDEERKAAGAQHHHWFAPLAGERFPNGIPAFAFSMRCAGCHGGMNGGRGSALQPAPDAITQASVTLALFEGGDRRRPIEPPLFDSATAIHVDFRRDVQPLLDRKCGTCHAGSSPAAGLSLTSAATTRYNDAYESLLARGADGSHRYVDAEAFVASRSFLAEKILGRELSAPRVLDAPCPPPGADPLVDDEKLVLLRWIELGAAFIGLPTVVP